jgi:hypothetical protein
MPLSHIAVTATGVVLFLIAEVPVHAYLDPGSGSMLVQLLLGGVAGLAVIARLGWRRLRERLRPRRLDRAANEADD